MFHRSRVDIIKGLLTCRPRRHGVTQIRCGAHVTALWHENLIRGRVTLLFLPLLGNVLGSRPDTRIGHHCFTDLIGDPQDVALLRHIAREHTSGIPVKASSGSDGAACGAHSASGLFTNFWWPLKRFFTPTRDQARRGTCWDFAALATLESRELVVSDHEVNLSEQFMAQRTKPLWDNADDFDGSTPAALLNNAVTTGTLIPQENYWTYNPASGRPDNAFQEDDPATPAVNEQIAGTAASYAGACKTYAPGGTCSETSHESPMVCAKIFPLDKYVCAYGSVQASTTGVKADKLVSVWYNNNDSKFPLFTVRNHLNNGRAHRPAGSQQHLAAGQGRVSDRPERPEKPGWAFRAGRRVCLQHDAGAAAAQRAAGCGRRLLHQKLLGLHRW